MVEKVKSKKSNTFGYDAAKNDYGDMIERGIADPTKVTRSALQNAASVAAMVLTTESPRQRPAGEESAGSGSAGRRHGRHVLRIIHCSIGRAVANAAAPFHFSWGFGCILWCGPV